LHVTDADIKKSLPTGAHDDLWMTAIVIALLERKYHNHKDEWILMVNKSKHFLAGNKADYSQAASKFVDEIGK